MARAAIAKLPARRWKKIGQALEFVSPSARSQRLTQHGLGTLPSAAAVLSYHH
jgi:hypothetical protein